MLRTRLFLNLVPFVVIVLAIGIYAIVLITHMTGNVDTTVTGNYRSVLAAQQMRLAASRIQVGVLLAMEDNNPLGTNLFEQNQRLFEDNLQAQLRHANSPQEDEINQRLAINFQTFKQAGAKILSLTQLAEQRRIFELRFMPGLAAIDKLLDDLRQMNNNAILATTETVHKITANVIRLMTLGILFALVLASYACFNLARSFLGPIQALTRATHDLAEGRLDQPVPVTTRDELGELAGAFNRMSAQLAAYRQSTAEKIVRLHRTMETTLASFPDPIFVLDCQGATELMNPAAMELAAALNLKNTLPDRLLETARKTLADGENFLPHSFKEVVSFQLNGQEKFFLPRVLAMRNDKDSLLGVAVVLYDVTRFRLLDDAKTNLVATVGHEIKTPLTSVRMVLHLLLEKTVGNLNFRQTELLTAARDDAERLLRILNDLLDITCLELGKTSLHREKIAPAELVQNAADSMRETIRAAGLHVLCNLEPDLPPVLVDRHRVKHVFANLFTNAIKYSPPGGVIMLNAVRAGEREVLFGVRDQGSGIPDEYQDRVFERFFRVPDQIQAGAGLGLSIAREIVLAHGGRIGVKSSPQQGTEFYFILGAATDQADPDAPLNT